MAAGDTARLYPSPDLVAVRAGAGVAGARPSRTGRRPPHAGRFRPAGHGAPAGAVQGVSARACRSSSCRATGRRSLDRRPRSSPAGTSHRRPTSICRVSPGCSTCRPGWCVSWSAPIVAGCSARPGRRAAASRSRSTSRPAGSPGSRTACTGTTRSATRLVQVGPPAGGEATTLIVTGVPWRTGWKYAERGFRHVYWDAGTMLAQTLALADSAGFQPRLWTRFADAEVDPSGRRRRHPRVPAGAGRAGRRGAGDPGRRRGCRVAPSTRRRPSSRSSRARSTRATATGSASHGRSALPCPIPRPPRTISMPSSCAEDRRA